MLRYKLIQPQWIIIHFILLFKWGKNPRLFRFYPISCSFLSSTKRLAGLKGFEPLAVRLKAGRSTWLSYRPFYAPPTRWSGSPSKRTI